MARKKKTVTLCLELMVDYNPKGASKEELAMWLANIANFAADRGLMTGDNSPATVENYWIHVKDIETGEYI